MRSGKVLWEIEDLKVPERQGFLRADGRGRLIAAFGVLTGQCGPALGAGTVPINPQGSEGFHLLVHEDTSEKLDSAGLWAGVKVTAASSLFTNMCFSLLSPLTDPRAPVQ